MANPSHNYLIGLNYVSTIQVADYDFTIDGQKCNVSFYKQLDKNVTSEASCYFVITDKRPEDLSDILPTLKSCSQTVVILNKFSDPKGEQQFQQIFSNAKSIKYTNLVINENSTKTLVNTEIIKDLVKNNRAKSYNYFFNPFTRMDLLKKIWKSSRLLLLPLLVILGYYISKNFLNHKGFYLLCWVANDIADCKTNWLEELRLFALFYACVNLLYYSSYILRIFDHINNDIFEYRPRAKICHQLLQLFCLGTYLLSSMTLLKSIFVFIDNFTISKSNIDVNIATVFDDYLPILKDKFLIAYFLSLDVILFFLVLNFFHAENKMKLNFVSVRQKLFLEDAKTGSIFSIASTLGLIILFWVLPDNLFDEAKASLAYQLIVLQIFYLGINILLKIADYKHS